MNSLEISFIGSACGKNKFEPRNKIMLLLLCREYKDLYKQLLFENGSFVLLDPNKKVYDSEIKRIYSEYKKNIKNTDEFEEVEKEIKKRLKTENKDIKTEDLDRASNFIENSMKKD
jgi:methyltransferase-like protein